MQSAFSSSITKKHLDETKGSCEPERKKLMLNQLHSSRDKVPDKQKTAQSKSEACNAELMPKLVKFTTKYRTPDGQKASSSRSLIARKQKSKEKIDWVELKKAKRMPNKLQSSLKVQAPDMHNASISRTLSVTIRQPEQGKELHAPNKANAMPSKRQSSSQHKTLSKQQVHPPSFIQRHATFMLLFLFRYI